LKHEPWKPKEVSPRVTLAIKGLAAGNASDEQQKLALRWIIEDVCGTYDWSYRPDDRDTHIALGMQRVGQLIVKEINIKMKESNG
jgi:hypothetical protein